MRNHTRIAGFVVAVFGVFTLGVSAASRAGRGRELRARDGFHEVHDLSLGRDRRGAEARPDPRYPDQAIGREGAGGQGPQEGGR